MALTDTNLPGRITSLILPKYTAVIKEDGLHQILQITLSFEYTAWINNIW
jgi:hypothetical protein